MIAEIGPHRISPSGYGYMSWWVGGLIATAVSCLAAAMGSILKRIAISGRDRKKALSSSGCCVCSPMWCVVPRSLRAAYWHGTIWGLWCWSLNSDKLIIPSCNGSMSDMTRVPTAAFANVLCRIGGFVLMLIPLPLDG